MRQKPRNDQELEAAAQIKRTEAPRPSGTEDDLRKMRRKILGSTWGKPRRKMEGWPK